MSLAFAVTTKSSSEQNVSLLSRRSFFKIAGLTGIVGLIEAFLRREAQAGQSSLTRAPRSNRQSHPRSHAPQRRSHSQDAQDLRYTFFNPDDAAFVEAAVERLIPADEHGPGALQAGVPIFIDRQLAGAWGTGGRLHRSGPWQPGSPTRHDRLPHTPAGLFRAALRGIEIDLGRRPQAPVASQASFPGWTGRAGWAGSRSTGRGGHLPVQARLHRPASISTGSSSARRNFAGLPAEDQAAYLKTLQAGGKDLAGIPSQVFFETLLGLTIEGFFSDPVHGGDEEKMAWRIHPAFSDDKNSVQS